MTCQLLNLYDIYIGQGDLIYVANIGDSRAVLATTSDDGNLVPIQLTVDFKPNLPREYFAIHSNIVKDASKQL